MTVSRHPRRRPFVVLALMAGGLALSVAVAGVVAPDHDVLPPQVAHAQLLDADGRYAISAVAERVLPSVVTISTRTFVTGPEMPGLHQFFDPFFQMGDGRQRERRGLGSGVIVDAKRGIVLTNNHVVAGADEITVSLVGGMDVPAEIVGTDPMSDVAVIRLTGALPALIELPVGDSDGLRLGEVVLAVGSPLGFRGSVTMGIVSAKGRADTGPTMYGDFIQTDAAINQGNSGGALVNMDGELVGINTWIASPGTGGSAGLGFAIPTNLARPIMESLLKDGQVHRGYLGVSMQTLDDAAVAESLGAKGSHGVLIADVTEGSPAHKGGLEPGDVIETFDGVTIDSMGRLRTEVARRPAGQLVRVEVLRQGRAKSLSVTLGEQPADLFARGAAPQGRGPRSDDLRDGGMLDGLGVQGLDELDEGLVRRYGVDSSVKRGAVVRSVETGSAAEKAGLREGDVIIELNRKPVTGGASFRKAYEASGDQVMLRVKRGTSVLFLVLSR